jgi:hypothetical protein
MKFPSSMSKGSHESKMVIKETRADVEELFICLRN